ncbi:MAG: hypothetical protein R3C01_08680 [Planctomycetaceae bacterium]
MPLLIFQDDRLMRISANHWWLPFVLVCGLSGLMVSSSWGDDAAPAAETKGETKVRDAAELVPHTTLLFAEIAAPKAAIGQLLDHPLWTQIRQLNGYRKGTMTPQYFALNVGVVYVESQLGMSWREALEGLTEGGVTAAYDAKTKGSVVIIQAKSEVHLTKVRDVFLRLAREDARNKKQPDPFQEVQHRNVTFYKTKGGAFATIGATLLLVNQEPIAREVADRLLDGTTSEFAKTPQFRDSRTANHVRPTLWVYGDIKQVRDSGVAPKVYSGKAENPGAELIFGGVLEVLQHADFFTLDFDLQSESVAIGLSLPFEQKWISESREYYFGPQGQGVAPELPPVENRLLALSTHRDFSQLWLRAGDLFDERTNDKLAEADSGLSTLFSGKDFGEEILGSFQPGLSLVVARQSFAADGVQPSIRLPAFALVMEMKTPEASHRELRRLFQSLIGFANFAGAQEGNPQLELNQETRAGSEIISSTFIPEVGDEQNRQAAIHFNFSPSVAFAGKRFVLSSTRTLAAELSATQSETIPSNEEWRINTIGHLNIPILQQVLEDNRSHLIAKNILEEGHSQKEAEAQISDLMDILEMFNSADMKFHTEPKSLRVKATLNFAKR